VKVFVALALFTGARKGSILSLTWDRVNLQTGMVDFQEPGRALTKKRRAIVPIVATLRVVLEEAKRMARSDYVVEYNGQPVPNGLRWSFHRLCQRAGLSWTPTPHHIKHSVASWFAMDKVPIDQAADWLATDPTTLRRVYRKFDPAYLRSVGGALDL
jgi:integrase